MKSKIKQLRANFYFKDGKPDLATYGVYRIGLTSSEIEDYLKVRGNTLNIIKLRKKFNDVAGCNTMGIAPTGESLMYRWDVERFAEKLFNNKPTYFD